MAHLALLENTFPRQVNSAFPPSTSIALERENTQRQLARIRLDTASFSPVYLIMQIQMISLQRWTMATPSANLRKVAFDVSKKIEACRVKRYAYTFLDWQSMNTFILVGHLKWGPAKNWLKFPEISATAVYSHKHLSTSPFLSWMSMLGSFSCCNLKCFVVNPMNLNEIQTTSIQPCAYWL